MQTIAFWNRKGGTGKTVTAGNTAGELAPYGRVLLVDCDSQADLSGWLNTEPGDYELADVLTAEVKLSRAVRTIRGGLDLLATFALGGTLQTFAETKLYSAPFAFADLRDQAQAAGYDWLLLDLAPSHSLLEKHALAISDKVVLVSQPEQFSRDGIELAESVIADVKANMRGRCAIVAMVANRVNRAYAEHEAVLNVLSGLGYPLYTIGQSTGISGAIAEYQFAREYFAGNPWVPEYRRLAEGLIRGEHTQTRSA